MDKAPVSAEKDIFDKVSSNDINGIQSMFADLKLPSVDFTDENGMTPLQHACYKGNKEIAQMLLDQGADVNSSKHEHQYTALHFAALSSNADLCQLLLTAGAKSHATNSVGRTPAQMAAFVGNHACVSVINNFVPRASIDYYTVPQGLEKEPRLPPFLAAPLHKFVMQVNMHPVRVALNLHGPLLDHLDKVKKILELMRDREARQGAETNEIVTFKFHYLSYITTEIYQIQQRQNQQQQTQMKLKEKDDKVDEKDRKWDPIELFIKNMLKPAQPGKPHTTELQERLLRECVREYPYRESNLLRQMVTNLAMSDSAAALAVISAAINGQRAFSDGTASACSTCGEEKAPKKCSKCKAVQYCDRECQRLHWFLHKKACARLGSTNVSVGNNGMNGAFPDGSNGQIDLTSAP
ncbi:ankyrin repeat and MYND domain-containing protein 2 [Thrips palmi]|uniref:Ankyrin repeat and MYND domain-containing protein 2 n=1 Tax=Thrips palmi TaxID=161013 RepID=A0A6P8Z475_THRPL|nr:ankyrin repeat and MYND domain-containing protein 2 [Thrips palmi]